MKAVRPRLRRAVAGPKPQSRTATERELTPRPPFGYLWYHALKYFKKL